MTLQGRVRAAQALQKAGLDVQSAGPLERASSITNEVWYAGPWVVRVNARPRRGNLRHEAEIARLLPAEVGYPEVVAYGEDAGAEWLIHRRIEGDVLSLAWPSLSEDQRRRATFQLAGKLQLIHGVQGAPVPSYLYDDTLECPHQLPPARTGELLQRAEALPFVDHGVLREAIELVEANASYVLADRSVSLVHGDLHFENVLWDGRNVSAVLDLEWARPEAPDLDLDVLLRFCAHPFLHVSDRYVQIARADDYRLVPKWLHDAYPALFARPNLPERLVVYGLAYDVRDLLEDPPDAPMPKLSTYHPMRRIATAVRQQGYVRGLNL
jgi:aminoglycoside phosphotransferase (APT) family kinase protein